MRGFVHGLTPMLVLLPLATGCGAPGAGTTTETWVGTITTVGNATTVINESGSVWGGTATLVEEASIGVAEGADEYMFGRPGGVYATAERIYVLDQQAQAVRVYDHAGIHLVSFGSRGQGPGELGAQPFSIGGADDGRIFVGDYGNRRINVYSADGEFLEDYPMGSVLCCMRQMVVTGAGVPWLQMREYSPSDPSAEYAGMQAHDETGPVGDVIRPPQFEVDEATWTFNGQESRIRFSPQVVWSVAPDAALIAGASDRYRFEVHHLDGRQLLVERYWAPVLLQAAEREWLRLYVVASVRSADPGWNWDGAELPVSKPAFENLIGTHSGETWVARKGPGIKDVACDDKHDPNDWPYYSENSSCWRDEPLVEAFDPNGVYLGGIEVPKGIILNAVAPPFVDGDFVVAALYEDDGVIRVKRYRLVPPEETS